jgi:hypothetical protein
MRWRIASSSGGASTGLLAAVARQPRMSNRRTRGMRAAAHTRSSARRQRR